jgi:Right handed beta helix region
VINGFNIHNAKFEGILSVNASDLTIVNNHVYDNNQAVVPGQTVCEGIPDFETSEGQDCGEGIHLIANNRDTVVHNEVDHNSGGILISDETGPSSRNVISSNFVHDNPYACGITMASHPPATSVIPTAHASFTIFRNTIDHNESAHNGLGLIGAGAGVGIFAPGPASGSFENVVISNNLHDNGLPGVTMHNHVAVPGLPAGDLDDNVIVANTFSNNAADTADAATAGPTGINIFSKVPVHGTVISQNVFANEAIDFAFNAPAGSQVNAHFNNFSASSVGVNNLGLGSVTATQNWWNCAAGPRGTGCATLSGVNIDVTPWLTSAFSETLP